MRMWKRSVLLMVCFVVLTASALIVRVSGTKQESTPLEQEMFQAEIFVPLASPAVVSSGTCGDGLIWVLDDENVLTISGKGSMDNYTYFMMSSSPWRGRIITEIVIEVGVTSIGDYAFADLFHLNAVTIPETVTSIGVGAFKGDMSLEHIQIPDSVLNINNGAFSGCGLTDIVLPRGITAIPFGCFRECQFTEFEVPDTVTEIQGDAFRGCSKLKRIDIPDSVVNFGAATFRDCTSLQAIKLPEADDWIQSYAFYNCSSLTEIVIPEAVEHIDHYAFSGCSSLSSVRIPSGVAAIGTEVFTGCDNLSGIWVDEGNQFFTNDHVGALYDVNMTHLHYVPNGLMGPYNISHVTTGVSDYAFVGCSRLTEITIPANVEWLLPITFSGCTNLSGIWVDEDNAEFSSDGYGVLFNKEKTILYCTPKMLPGSYDVPVEVTWIYPGAFADCVRLISVTISEVDTLDRGTFDGCRNLMRVVMPSTVLNIGGYAFNGCDSLVDVYYDGTLEEWTEIEVSYGNEPLSNARIHAIMDYGMCGDEIKWELYTNGTLILSGNSEIHPCSDLPVGSDDAVIKEVIICEGILTIGASAFQGYDNMTSVTIPNTVTSIEASAFSGCTALKNVYYYGDEASWNQIDRDQDNEILNDARIFYNIGKIIIGDYDSNFMVADADALYLLRHTLFAERYPVNQDGDVNADGTVNDADALYLLRYTLFPERYPLYPSKKG